MQPWCRHMPPTLSFSMSATFLPSSAARSAQATVRVAVADVDVSVVHDIRSDGYQDDAAACSRR